MELEEIAVRRLSSQALLGSTCHSPEAVVAWMVATQAQEYPGAKWSLGVRQAGSTEAEVERSIAGKAIVRSWLMRGTLHFVRPEDILWLLTLLGPKLIAGNQRRYRELELEEKTLLRSNDLIVKALQKEKSLTRKELLGLIREAGLSTEGQRGIFMLQRASLDRLICQGTVSANNPAFMSLEGFPSRALSHAEALTELASRYFTSRGPATVQDFTWWSGLPAAEARAGLETIRSGLEQEAIEGQVYWWSGSSQTPNRRTSSSLVLPPYDEFLIAYKDRRASLGLRNFNQLAPTGGMPPGSFVLDGRVRGTWKRTFTKEGLAISIRPFESLNKAEEARVAFAADAFGRFMGRTGTIRKDRLESGDLSNK